MAPSTSTNPDEQRTADRLFRAAAQLFRQKGFAATSMRELSEGVGIQKASVYHHIRTKEDLLYRIALQSLDRIALAVTEARDAVPEAEQLHAMIVSHVKTALEDRDLHATMLTEMRSLSQSRRDEVLKARDRYERLLSDAIERGQASGRLRNDIGVRAMTLALLNLLNWTIFWYEPGGKQTPEQIGETLASIFLDGASI